jgi:GNAT superfamily N-acetyltransferase
MMETIERHALKDWFDSVARIDSSEIDWSMATIGDAHCFVSSSEPSILVNRTLQLGSKSPPTLAQLIEIRELYRNAGVSRFFLHVIPGQLGTDGEQLLTDAGFERYRGWMKFSRGSGEVRPITSDLSIRRIGMENSVEFAAIVADAFDFDPAFRPAIAALPSDPHWHVYMSFAGETPAGTGALYLRDGLGYLDFGATHPDFRRRGSQTAILNTRIRDALDTGCETIITMTGEAVPGDKQHSYRNIQKAGFKEAYLRENWIPTDT